MLSEAQILARLRKICLALPGAIETVSFGHPTFKVNGKTFSVFEEYKGELGICVKIEKELQGIFLDDSRFFRTPYIGKHGWVTLRVHAARLNWTEVKDLVRGSYRLVLAGRPASPSRSSKKGASHQI
jgi:predicted DNA-binding protein (MmcQ/YjbR family)